jgi:protein TonB
MFEKMVVSTAEKSPAVTTTGWGVVIGVFVVLTPILWFVESQLAGATYGPSVVLSLAIVLAAVVAVYVLMLIFAWGDSGRMRINRAAWTTFVALLPVLVTLVGFMVIPELALVVAISGLLIAIAVYLIYTGFRTGEWRRATVPLSTIFQVVLLGVMVLVPLLYTDALPKKVLGTLMLEAVPPPAQATAQRTPKPGPRPIQEAPGTIVAPESIPTEIAVIEDEPITEPAMAGGVGVPGGILDSPLTGIIGRIISGTAPPSIAPPRGVPATPIRVGGNVQQARLIHHVKPVYPPLAIPARVQGMVRLEALISKDGTIQNLHVLSGHPLLIPSAMDAVRQWRYQPTLLNGEPVEVVTTIDVVFILVQ